MAKRHSRKELLVNLDMKELIEDYVSKKITKTDFLSRLDKQRSIVFSLFKGGDDTYFGNMLLGFSGDNIQYELDDSIIAAVAVNKDRTNLKLILNPILFVYPQQVIKFVLKHELMHVLLGHMSTRFDYASNQYLCNISQDCAINQIIDIDRDKYFKSKEELLDKFGGVSFRYIADMIEKKLGINNIKEKETSEYYYDLLMQISEQSANNDKSNPLTNGAGGSGKADGSGGDKSQDDQGTESGGDQNKTKPKGQKTCAINDAEDVSEIDWTFDSPSAKVMLHHVQEGDTPLTEAQAQALSGLLNTRGTISTPPNIKEIIDKSFDVHIPWQELLSDYIRSIIHGTRKTFFRRDRRQPNVLYIRGRLADRTCNIKIVIDTSGSIVALAGYFLKEIESMFASFSEIEVAECDTDVRRTYKIEKRKEIKDVEGGGGTILEPGISHFAKNKRDKPDVIIIFTDGYCESHIDNPKVPLIWVVTDNVNNLCTSPSYGKVIKMDTSRIKM